METKKAMKAYCELGALNNVAQRNVAPTSSTVESSLEYTNHPNEPTTLLAFLEVEQTVACQSQSSVFS